MVSAVGPVGRIGHLDLVVLEVAHGHFPAGPVDGGYNGLTDGAFGHGLDPMVSYQPEGLCQVRLFQYLPRFHRKATLEKGQVVQVVVLDDLFEVIGYDPGLHGMYLKAFLGKAKGRLGNFGECHGAEFVKGSEYAEDLPRHTDSLAAHGGPFLVLGLLGSIHVFGGRGRCDFTVIQEYHFTCFCVPDHHEPSAAKSRGVWLNNVQRQHRRYRRVNGVAALLHDLHACHGGKFVG